MDVWRLQDGFSPVLDVQFEVGFYDGMRTPTRSASMHVHQPVRILADESLGQELREPAEDDAMRSARGA
jgi:hypothetical protein